MGRVALRATIFHDEEFHAQGGAVPFLLVAGRAFGQTMRESCTAWAVWVNANWGITFRFAGEGAGVVDYQDYH